MKIKIRRIEVDVDEFIEAVVISIKISEKIPRSAPYLGLTLFSLYKLRDKGV